MKKVLFLFVICIAIWACSKEEQLVKTTTTSSSRTQVPDMVYHYQGKEYPLYLVKGSTDEYVEDENTKALDKITSSISGLATFSFSNKPSNHYYLFDSEFDGYDYMEKHDENPTIGRRFKVAYRIDELRDKLLDKYGENIDYTNRTIYAEALANIELIYTELKIKGEIPRDVESFIGKKEKPQGTPRYNPLMQVWVDISKGGAMLDIETAPNTVTWTHGPYNCFRTSANPDLTQEFQPNSNNWNDCISSLHMGYVDGADAVCYASYKDTYYAQYGCSRLKFVIGEGENTDRESLDNLSNVIWASGCGHMNDQISSIRIKVAWQGCPLVWTDL